MATVERQSNSGSSAYLRAPFESEPATSCSIALHVTSPSANLAKHDITPTSKNYKIVHQKAPMMLLLEDILHRKLRTNTTTVTFSPNDRPNDQPIDRINTQYPSTKKLERCQVATTQSSPRAPQLEAALPALQDHRALQALAVAAAAAEAQARMRRLIHLRCDDRRIITSKMLCYGRR
jgi:hypothetical protein